jgi:isopenicillin N synthase-like dioxygenase
LRFVQVFMAAPELPIVNVDAYRFQKETATPKSTLTERSSAINIQKDCARLADALSQYGAVVVEDSTVLASDNEAFLELMAAYFAQPDKTEDARPELNYQVGWTPAFTERPRPVPSDFRGDDPVTPRSCDPSQPSPPDPKERFLWRIGPRPRSSRFPEQNATPVIPHQFAEHWALVMNRWGSRLLDVIRLVAEMTALGLGLERDAFTSRMEFGPHLLAPTGSNLSELRGKPDTVLAGFHYDLCFLTIHGKANAPGLYLWTREGRRFPARVPKGCLLVQAGLQLEWLTGGIIRRGFHEVVADEAALTVARLHDERQQDMPPAQRRPFWRISSTLFAHIASDQVLEPLPELGHSIDALQTMYPPILAGALVRQELRAIALCPSTKVREPYL